MRKRETERYTEKEKGEEQNGVEIKCSSLDEKEELKGNERAMRKSRVFNEDVKVKGVLILYT